MNIIGQFMQHARATPDKVALHVDAQRRTYAELCDETDRLCTLLRDMGVGEGSHVLISLENGVAFVETLLAAAAMGAVIAPVSTTLGADGLAASMQAADVDYVVAGTAVARRLLDGEIIAADRMLVVGHEVPGCRRFAALTALPPAGVLADCDVDPGAAYLLTMTSGSTGAPKPIVLTQAGKLRRALDGARDLYGLDADDVVITATPMYHSLGFRLALLPLLLGASGVILTRFTPRAYVDAVNAHAVTFSIVVSSQLESVLEVLDADVSALPSLVTLVSSSALLRPEIKARCTAQLDCAFHECYGASEVGIVTDLGSDDADRHPGSVGRALAYVDISIVDERGAPRPPGQVGEICCRTTTLFAGYFRQPDATAASMADGYFKTGDLGYVDADGYLYLAGRKKDIIIVGGTNVYPDDVEAVLRDAPGVADSAVIGVADAYFGEAVLACIVASSDGADARSIQAYCVQRLADYQVPQLYEFVDRLPRTSLGKIRRQTLRERFADYDSGARLRRLRALATRAARARA